jgi:protein TonB
MVPKKTNRTNLEKKSILFFEYGVVMALAIALAAFEWGTRNEMEILDNLQQQAYIPETMIEITRPEPPKQVAPVIPIEIIRIDDAIPDIESPDFNFTTETTLEGLVDIVYWEPREEESSDPEIFIRVEKMPTYHGGSEAEFQKHLQQLVIYPREAQEMNIEGKVILKFVVDENGKLVKPEILLSSHELLSNAVMEALEKTSKWTPGEQRTRKVKVAFNVPIFFRLQ